MTSLSSSVSVVIPTHRRANLLARAILSALEQGEVVGEVIVVDDNTDPDEQSKVRGIVECFDSPKLIYHRNELSGGGSGARNTGISHARFEFVAFLDDDDEWAQGKIACQLAAIDDHSTVGAFSAYRERDNIFCEEIEMSWSRRVLTEVDLLRGECPTSTSLAVVRSEILRHVGGFDTKIHSFEDYDLWLKCAAYGKFACVNDAICFYTQHRGARLSIGFDKRIEGLKSIFQRWGGKFGSERNLSREIDHHAAISCIQYSRAALGFNNWNAFQWAFRALRKTPRSPKAMFWICCSVIGYRGSRLLRRCIRAFKGTRGTQYPLSVAKFYGGDA